MSAPLGAGVVMGLLSRINESDALAVFAVVFLLASPLVGGGASYWLSCRVMDRWGQPWAFMSFFASLASWVLGVWMFIDLSGMWRK
jgi:hypothetical protein